MKIFLLRIRLLKVFGILLLAGISSIASAQATRSPESSQPPKAVKATLESQSPPSLKQLVRQEAEDAEAERVEAEAQWKDAQKLHQRRVLSDEELRVKEAQFQIAAVKADFMLEKAELIAAGNTISKLREAKFRVDLARWIEVMKQAEQAEASKLFSKRVMSQEEYQIKQFEAQIATAEFQNRTKVLESVGTGGKPPRLLEAQFELEVARAMSGIAKARLVDATKLNSRPVSYIDTTVRELELDVEKADLAIRRQAARVEQLSSGKELAPLADAEFELAAVRIELAIQQVRFDVVQKLHERHHRDNRDLLAAKAALAQAAATVRYRTNIIDSLTKGAAMTPLQDAEWKAKLARLELDRAEAVYKSCLSHRRPMAPLEIATRLREAQQKLADCEQELNRLKGTPAEPKDI